MSTLAIAWLLHQRVVTSVILGAKRLDQLEEHLKAADVTLSDDDLKTLDPASALAPEYPALDAPDEQCGAASGPSSFGSASGETLARLASLAADDPEL